MFKRRKKCLTSTLSAQCTSRISLTWAAPTFFNLGAGQADYDLSTLTGHIWSIDNTPLQSLIKESNLIRSSYNATLLPLGGRTELPSFGARDGVYLNLFRRISATHQRAEPGQSSTVTHNHSFSFRSDPRVGFRS